MDDGEEEKDLLTTVISVQHLLSIGVIPLLAKLEAVDHEMFQSEHSLKNGALVQVNKIQKKQS